jgi:UDP-2,3-diacylglucosamine pyrophosphatase LpxH
MVRPTVVLADVHLVRTTPAPVTNDLARLIRSHAGHRIVVNGDLFDLSADDVRLPRDVAVGQALAAHPAALSALSEHVDRGGELWLVSGNHDAEVGAPGFRETLLAELRVSPEARDRVRTSAWFFRVGGLHVEHGHLYDPDNAPAHPLVMGEPSLGVHFVEQFIGPAGAHRYLTANDDTPLHLFLSSFAWYGPRAPYVIYRYFYTAFGALLRSGPLYRANGEVDLGRNRVRAASDVLGVTGDEIERLAALRATPTLESTARTFSRLYFDRVIGTLSLSAGLGAALSGQRRAASALGALGASILAGSWAMGHNRYRGSVSERLAASARAVANVANVPLVVFGHTHSEALEEGYANTGSFSFPGRAPGRPYLLIEGSHEAPRAVRRYLLPA